MSKYENILWIDLNDDCFLKPLVSPKLEAHGSSFSNLERRVTFAPTRKKAEKLYKNGNYDLVITAADVPWKMVDPYRPMPSKGQIPGIISNDSAKDKNEMFDCLGDIKVDLVMFSYSLDAIYPAFARGIPFYSKRELGESFFEGWIERATDQKIDEDRFEKWEHGRTDDFVRKYLI